MAGHVVDEQFDVMSDGLFDNIEDFLDFSPDDEVLGIVNSASNDDGGGNGDLRITADVAKGAFLNLDDEVCRVATNLDENKICDDINIGDDWVSKFLDDSYIDLDFSATTAFINHKDESQLRSPSPISVLKPNSLNSSDNGGSSSSSCSSSSCISSNNEISDTVSLAHVWPTATLVPARARSKRPRRAARILPSMPIPILPCSFDAAPILPNMPTPILPCSFEGPPVIPTLLLECESVGESCPPLMKKKKKKSPEDGDASAESGIATRKCLHCGIQKTPQWRSGPMGPKTLCNACGVRYKSGRLFPEYRPAASPTFVPTIHSNSHKRVAEMRIKACQEKVESGMPLPQYPAAKNCELLAYIK